MLNGPRRSPLTIEIGPREWKDLRRLFRTAWPIVVFGLLLGISSGPAAFVLFGLGALIVVAIGIRLATAIQARHFKVASGQYAFPASMDRRSGRLELDHSGVRWQQVRGTSPQPEWIAAWSTLKAVNIRPMPAIAPLSKLVMVDDQDRATAFISAIDRRRVEQMLRETLPIDADD